MRAHVCVLVRTCVFMCLCVFAYVCMYRCMHVFVWSCACMYVWFAHINAWFTYIHQCMIFYTRMICTYMTISNYLWSECTQIHTKKYTRLHGWLQIRSNRSRSDMMRIINCESSPLFSSFRNCKHAYFISVCMHVYVSTREWHDNLREQPAILQFQKLQTRIVSISMYACVCIHAWMTW